VGALAEWRASVAVLCGERPGNALMTKGLPDRIVHPIGGLRLVQPSSAGTPNFNLSIDKIGVGA